MKKELYVIVSETSAFFYTAPPRELLKLLKKYGLEFVEEKVVFCG